MLNHKVCSARPSTDVSCGPIFFWQVAPWNFLLAKLQTCSTQLKSVLCHAVPCHAMPWADSCVKCFGHSIDFDVVSLHPTQSVEPSMLCDAVLRLKAIPTTTTSRRILIKFAKKRNQINFSFVWFRILVNSMCVQPKKSKCVRPQRAVCLSLSLSLSVPGAGCRLPVARWFAVPQFHLYVAQPQ